MILYNNTVYNNISDLKNNITKEEYSKAIKNKSINFNYRQDTPKEYDSIKLFYFKNTVNGHTISSIYDNLDNLKELKDFNVNEWIHYEP